MNNYLILLALLFLSCSNDGTGTSATEPTQTLPNILLIIADDMGKDATNGFSEGSIKPNTPNIDAIQASGLSFDNFWVYPTCSPTRASILTGKYGYRTGVKWAGDAISTNETILQKYISDNTNDAYNTAIVGKWHVSGNAASINPESFGLDYYSGIYSGAVPNYYDWQRYEDGATITETEYTTTKLTALAEDFIASSTKPWFTWLAYNAPHTPFHVPPSNMHSQGALPTYSNGMDATPYYMAAIEAMDFKIGELLNSLSDTERANTIIIFIGDNGTPNRVAQFPYSNNTVKGTLYQGGINTPMFISGKGVSRSGTDNNLISSTDLFATIAEIAGVTVSEINDSKSIYSLLTASGNHREFQYSEMNDGFTNAWTIRNNQYKLTINANGNQEMYDLLVDPYEANDLVLAGLTTQQSAAKNTLETELAIIRN